MSGERRNETVAVTIDVESDWGGRTDSYRGIRDYLPFILAELDRFDIKATFFISGEVISGNKDIICEISKSGHEIASHSQKHNIDHSRLSKEELFNQIDSSKKLLEDEIGAQILGFRTPQFRINVNLLDVLNGIGFRYDSSMIRSILPSRYSGLSVPAEPFFKSGILEIPVSAMPYLKVPMGLRWINAMGFNMFKFFVERFKAPDTLVLYLHPFDLVVHKSRSDFGLLLNSWYNYKAGSTKDTLTSVLDYFKNKNRQFLCLRDVLFRDESGANKGF